MIQLEVTPSSSVQFPKSSLIKKLFLDTDGQVKLLSFDGSVKSLEGSKPIPSAIVNIEALQNILYPLFDYLTNLLNIESEITDEKLQATSKLINSLFEDINNKLNVIVDSSNTNSQEVSKSFNQQASKNDTYDILLSNSEEVASGLKLAVSNLEANIKTVLSDLENKQATIDVLIDISNKNNTSLVDLNKSVLDFVSVLNKRIDSKASISDLKRLEEKIPKIDIVAGSSNVHIEKENETYSISVDVEKVTQQVIQSGGGISSNKVQKMIDESISGITPSASSDLSNYTLLSTTSSISGNLQNQINLKANSSDLSNYTLLSTTATISAGLGNVASTGVYESGAITIATSASFTIPPLKGWIVENTGINATNPKIINVVFAGGTYPVTNISTQSQTYVLIDATNQIIQIPNFPTATQRRQMIFLGKIVHNNLSSINTINNTADYDTSPFSALRDMFASINILNGGVTISPNGTNKSIARNAGTIYGLGINWANNQTSPNTIDLSGQPLVTIRSYVTRSTLIASNQTVIDPANYDLNGTLTAIGGGSNESSNQRVYQFPNGNIVVQYGQKAYSNLAAAVAGIATESFVPYPNTIQSAVLIAYISLVKTASDLSNTSHCIITPGGLFGQPTGGTSNISTGTLQQAYDNSITPEIVINSTLDGFTLKNGTGNADSVTHLLEGQTTAGLVTSFIMADGNGNFTGLTASNISGSSGSIVTHDANGKLLDSGILVTALTPLTTTSSISAGLNTRIGTLEEIVTKTGEPRGFENRTSSTLSFNESTLTFNISGSFNIWQNGVKIAKTSDTQVIANTTGTHYLYYNASGIFSYSMTVWDILVDVPIAIICWDATTQKGILVEERHGIIMDSVTHKYLHSTKGTQLISAGALDGYTPTQASPTIAGQTYGIGATIIADEDLITTTSAFVDGSSYTCVSRIGSGSDWTITTGRTLPFLVGTLNSYIAYNLNTGGTWSLAQYATTNTTVYGNYYIVAIPAIETRYQYVIVPGQATYASLALAQGESTSNLNLTGFPFAEFVFIYRVTYRYGQGYTLTNRGRIEAVASINDNVFTSGITPSSNHNALSGLQGGTTGEYYHITSTQSDDWIGASSVANISGGLDSRITTINNNYATKATPISGTYNTVVVNSQGIVTSGGNVNYSVDLTPYTLLTTTSSISGSLLNGVSASLTYDISGNLSTYTSSKGTKVFTYSNGLLVSISGSGEYRSKTLSYSGNILQSITVI